MFIVLQHSARSRAPIHFSTPIWVARSHDHQPMVALKNIWYVLLFCSENNYKYSVDQKGDRPRKQYLQNIACNHLYRLSLIYQFLLTCDYVD